MTKDVLEKRGKLEAMLTETTDMNAHTEGSQFSMFPSSDMISLSAGSFANFNKTEGFQFQGTGNQCFLQ